jgi:oligopeptide transport system ATP-binding protein
MTDVQRSREPLLDARDIDHVYIERSRPASPARVVHAVRSVSLTIQRGEVLGLVGETGSGKSTLARALVHMPPPLSGSITYQGVRIEELTRRQLRSVRRTMQLIFQQPYASLNPRWRVASIVAEPLAGFNLGPRAQRQQRTADLLECVGLDPRVYAGRLPGQLSGGECQRVAIARALSAEPDLLICDEVTSSLDPFAQREILRLFRRLHDQMGLTYLFISHDLEVVAEISDRVASMYDGSLCEIASCESLYRRPAHPYTAELLAHAGEPLGRMPGNQDCSIEEEPLLKLAAAPRGCGFRARCPVATSRCATEAPRMRSIAPDHAVSCHHPLA